MFKKVFAVLLTAVMVFSFAGCKPMEPAETSVTNYLNAIKAQDQETIAKYTGAEYDASAEEEVTDDFSQYMVDELLGNMAYEIISSEEAEETAAVTVAFTNVNMTVVMSEVFAEAFSLIFADMTEEELNTAMQGFFVTAMENHQADVVTKEVTLELTKGETHWIVTPTDEMMDAAIGGLAAALSNIE